MQELSPVDRYQIRKAQMDADKKQLEARRTQQELDRLVLELEHKYDLIADGGTIDPRAATIQAMPSMRKGNGKVSTEELALAAIDDVTGE